MNAETIARRYSTALADSAAASGQTEIVKAELEALGKTFADSTDLQTVFSNPSIAHSSKAKVLDELIARAQPSKTTANFLKILFQNGRLGELGQINERFVLVLEERGGRITAEITSARELPEDERAEFEKNLARLTGKQVSVNYAIDTEIIGGVVTRIGSTVYDGSVKTKLENLKEQLVNG